MPAADSARKLAALVTIAGVVGASQWLQPAPRPEAPLLGSRAMMSTAAVAPEVARRTIRVEKPDETTRPETPRRPANEPLGLPASVVVQSDVTVPQFRPPAFTEPLVPQRSDTSPPVLIAAALRLDVGLAPAVDVSPLATANRSPLGHVFSVAGRSLGMVVRRTGGAAQGVLIAGTVMIRRVVHL